MDFLFSNRFKKDYKKMKSADRKALLGKLELLADNQYHPSLRTKKVQGTDDVFECSVNMSIRMTWQYFDGKIFLRAVGKHDIVLKNP